MLCPHCGKPIESRGTAEGSWYEYRPGKNEVSLGCGTLILIAIIVAIFSKSGDNSDEIRDLQREIEKMEQQLDRLVPAVEKLSQSTAS